MGKLISTFRIALAVSLFIVAHDAPATAYSCNSRYYTNSEGQRVHSPTCSEFSKSYTAICRDGSYSYSRHHRGTCSRHGGVMSWR